MWDYFCVGSSLIWITNLYSVIITLTTDAHSNHPKYYNNGVTDFFIFHTTTCALFLNNLFIIVNDQRTTIISRNYPILLMTHILIEVNMCPKPQ